MCAPLAVVAAGVSAVGQGISALQAAANARYEAKLAERNAAMESEAARDTLDNSREKALRLYQKTGALQGQQQAAMAANGVDLGFGSPLAVQRDIAAAGASDVQSLHDETSRDIRRMDLGAAGYRARARTARRNASNALVGGVFDVATTVLNRADRF